MQAQQMIIVLFFFIQCKMKFHNFKASALMIVYVRRCIKKKMFSELYSVVDLVWMSQKWEITGWNRLDLKKMRSVCEQYLCFFILYQNILYQKCFIQQSVWQSCSERLRFCHSILNCTQKFDLNASLDCFILQAPPQSTKNTSTDIEYLVHINIHSHHTAYIICHIAGFQNKVHFAGQCLLYRWAVRSQGRALD